MMKLLTLFVLSFGYCFAQDANRYLDSITSADLKKHLEIITSDEYEGRETGEKGQKMTAEYLSQEFQKYGLLKAEGLETYFQTFDLYKTIPGGTIESTNNKLHFPKDFLYTGIDTVFFSNVSFVPVNVIEASLKGSQNEFTVVVKGKNENLRELFEKRKNISELGFGGVVFLIEDWGEFTELYSHYFGDSKLFIPGEKREPFATVFINKKSFERTFAQSKQWKKWIENTSNKPPTKIDSVKVSLMQQVVVVETENVLAIIPGSDTILKNEILILTAHYDHLGIENGEIYNGADDDGSGTVALLEIAQSFAYAYQNNEGPKRTVLIMPVTAEEKGLLGSRFYSLNPIYPMESTIANLNIDMIGRKDAFHDNPNYVYIIGSDMLSDDLHRINEEAGEELNAVELDYKYNTKDDPNRFYYRSDHYNFVVKGVPSIFYFSGVHEDYHQPTDTVDKIDFEKMEKITKLIFLTAWKLANTDKRPVVNKEK